ncbi:DMT family transporter [Vibrio methylphosphonaticus]|uniref:DMT family transporter n=1 Tax=Vibrio methylphosphonaticus TaxID=2946866 RepID=UPI002029F612|nr:DMT family transporter [Vibrio methylphosphonaticus]MCL9776244.1 DMT family transporter [Vibrio methylphosphonaticus]
MLNSPDHRAVGFMLSSTLSLSITGVVTKFLASDMSAGNLTILRFLLPAVVLLLFLVLTSIRLPPKEMRRILAIRSLSIGACQLCFIYAIDKLSLVESVVLFGTGPLFIMLFETVFFRIRLSFITIASLLLTSIGVVLLAGDVSGFSAKPEVLVGLLAGVFNAGSQLSLHRASKGSMSGIENNAWTFLFAGVAIVPIVFVTSPDALSETWHAFTTPRHIANHWETLTLLALLTVMVINTQTSRYKAYQLAATNSQIAPLIYTNLIFTAVWQFAFFDVVFTHPQIFGLSLIIGANVMCTMIKRPFIDKKSRSNRHRPPISSN